MMTISRPKGSLVIPQDRSSDEIYVSSTFRTLWSHLNGRFVAILALVLANVVFGTTFVATKPMLDRIPPLTIATGRFAIALLVLMPLLLRSGRRPNLGRTSALLGVGAVILCGNGAKLNLSLVGDSLILLSAAAMAAYLVIGRKVFSGEDTLEIIAGATCYGLLFLVPASGAEIVTRGIERPTNGDLACWIYLGVVASALAFLLESAGLRHLEAGQVGLFANLSPLVGIVVAALFLGESISLYQIGGGALILGGVWFATRRDGNIQVESATVHPLELRPSDDLVLALRVEEPAEVIIVPVFSTVDLDCSALQPTFADDCPPGRLGALVD